MSLLIKALDKAQEQAQLVKLQQAQQTQQTQSKETPSEQLQADTFIDSSKVKRKPVTVQAFASADASADLSLEPSIKASNSQHTSTQLLDPQANLSPKQAFASNSTPPEPPNTHTINNVSAQSAANIFSAKQTRPSGQNTSIIVMIVAGLLISLAIGTYFYQLKNNTPFSTAVKSVPASINLQETLIKKSQDESRLSEPLPALDDGERAVEPALAMNIALPAKVNPTTETVAPVQMAQLQEKLLKNPAKLTPRTTSGNAKTSVTKDLAAENIDDERLAAEIKTVENSEAANGALIAAKNIVNKQAKSNKQFKSNHEAAAINVPFIASNSASMRVTKTQSPNSINPVLMSAFDAYNAGKDTLALKLYKQVLQRDVHNNDALLGLGAIAQRQGRLNDASGWYSKVLEVEPKNSIAMTFMLENQPQTTVENTETQLKNMLAKQPDDANLHALLGNFFAQNNQWPAAQQAYFDAYRLNASAENALNLAVSLDQMGKPTLALPYYQQALERAKIGSTNIDKASVEARIKAIS